MNLKRGHYLIPKKSLNSIKTSLASCCESISRFGGDKGKFPIIASEEDLKKIF